MECIKVGESASIVLPMFIGGIKPKFLFVLQNLSSQGSLPLFIFVCDRNDRNSCNGEGGWCVVAIWCFDRESVLRVRQKFVYRSIPGSHPLSGIQFPFDCESLVSSWEVLCSQYRCQSPVDILRNHTTIITGFIRIMIPGFCGVPALGSTFWYFLEISATGGIPCTSLRWIPVPPRTPRGKHWHNRVV